MRDGGGPSVFPSLLFSSGMFSPFSPLLRFLPSYLLFFLFIIARASCLSLEKRLSSVDPVDGSRCSRSHDWMLRSLLVVVEIIVIVVVVVPTAPAPCHRRRRIICVKPSHRHCINILVPRSPCRFCSHLVALPPTPPRRPPSLSSLLSPLK